MAILVRRQHRPAAVAAVWTPWGTLPARRTQAPSPQPAGSTSASVRDEAAGAEAALRKRWLKQALRRDD